MAELLLAGGGVAVLLILVFLHRQRMAAVRHEAEFWRSFIDEAPEPKDDPENPVDPAPPLEAVRGVVRIADLEVGETVHCITTSGMRISFTLMTHGANDFRVRMAEGPSAARQVTRSFKGWLIASVRPGDAAEDRFVPGWCLRFAAHVTGPGGEAVVIKTDPVIRILRDMAADPKIVLGGA